MAGDPPNSIGGMNYYYQTGNGYTCAGCGRFVAWGDIHSCLNPQYNIPSTLTFTNYPTDVQNLREYVEKRFDVLEGKLDFMARVDKLIERIDKILKEWEEEDVTEQQT
jgi:recombinational DNA repair protein RecR